MFASVEFHAVINKGSETDDAANGTNTGWATNNSLLSCSNLISFSVAATISATSYAIEFIQTTSFAKLIKSKTELHKQHN